MYDGVVFLDGDLRVILWNRGAERLTGIDASAVLQHHFTLELVGMRDEHGKRIEAADFPVSQTLRTGVQTTSRLVIRGRAGHDVLIDAHIIPVAADDGTLHGVTLLLHDASPEASLEERCQRLHEKAIRDPLTQLANRAEFDRVRTTFIDVHRQRELPCSLIICDIDHFKHVNDNYGHPAGDEVLRNFAQLLKGSCRSGDLVARYGGEEFVMLCADCNMAAAFERANLIRRTFATMAHPSLHGKPITASFGVTETQPGDTPDTMLHRADRALLSAKEGGRNLVLQLGAGRGDEGLEPRRRWWQIWQSVLPDALLEQNLIARVPLNVTIEKLRGFFIDHLAEVESVSETQIRLLMQGDPSGMNRRSTDRSFPMLVDLGFVEEQVQAANASGLAGGVTTRTKVKVAIRPKRGRDRRQSDAVARARRVLDSLRSYLMAVEDTGSNGETVIHCSNQMLIPWLLKQRN